MSAPNTLNICLSHIPLPQSLCAHVDLMIAPRHIIGPPRVAVVDDSYFGEFGSSLSEYSQLLWLYDHFDAIVSKYDYIRIFQYRRFVAQNEFGLPCSQPWAKRIRVDELSQYSNEFNRSCAGELFNRAIHFNGGMLGQYASAHIREDILNFSKFLIEESIFDPLQASLFLKEALMIPSSNLGTFRKVTLREILSTLKRAAAFLRSNYFVPRPGYQRRVMGFLLERLTSYLILMRIGDRASEPNFGHHMIISNDYIISNAE
jgi:hypothetical protein